VITLNIYSYGAKTLKTSQILAYGKNPVIEAIRSGAEVRRIYIKSTADKTRLGGLVSLVASRGIPIEYIPSDRLVSAGNSLQDQVVCAEVKINLFEGIKELVCSFDKEQLVKQVFVVLDGVSDPQNLGAIMRTCEATGVKALILRKRRAAPITPAVIKASSGAIFYLKVAQVPNIPQALRELDKLGFWIYCVDPTSKHSIFDYQFRAPLVLVFGDEGQGISSLTRRWCYDTVMIPMYGKIQSLNVSVAAGIVLYAVRRWLAF
jgi:23S rRNA (guanosine2251-2'-O)-methyltransferase